MENRLNAILNNFRTNTERIDSLLSFDELVQQICLSGLRKAKKGLERCNAQNHPSFSVDNQISLIERIRENESLVSHYQVMYNQCVVLLVSYFSSAVEDIFKETMKDRLERGSLTKIEDEEIKVTISQFKTGDIAEIFVQKKDDINFQDMRSTLRSFEEYLGFQKTERDEIIDNIILAQAMRHCIVHNGCKINSKCIRQLRDANKRTLKTDLHDNDEIQFNEDEVHTIKMNMLDFINRLITTA